MNALIGGEDKPMENVMRLLEPALRLLIAFVWLANGLWAKVLDGVLRHRQIVGRLFGDEWAGFIIVAIGFAEVVMAAWVWSGWRVRFCAITQIVVVMAMNVIEQWLTRDLLLWGPMNFVYAGLFCMIVAYHGFRLSKA